MDCPRCQKPLEKVVDSDIELDVCLSGCAGIWFDQFEFKKFDEPHEPAVTLLKLLPNQPAGAASISRLDRLDCPKCADVVMMRAFHSPLRQIEIDECPMCASVWLDHGELAFIRDMFRSEKQLKEYRQAAFERELGSEIDNHFSKRAADFERIDKYARLFRWLTPD